MAVATRPPACFIPPPWSRAASRARARPSRLRGGGQDPGGRLIFRQRCRAGDQALELVQRQVANRLEDLLVGPANFTRLLVEVEGWRPFRVERLLQVEEQGRLLLVGRGEAAGAGDLVEAESGPACRLRVLGDAVVVLAVLGACQGDP